MDFKKNKLFTIIIMLIILSPLSSLFNNVIAADESPKYIHLSWQHDPKTTMTISWRTNIETESIVQYGVDDSSTFEQVGTSGKWHAVELTSLHPDTKYLYRVGNGEIWCAENNFKTGTEGNHTTFVAWGDSRHYRPERRSVVEIVNSLFYDFSVFTGDFIDNGLYIDQWYNLLADFKPVLENTSLMPLLGNHEENSSIYYDIFALPGKEEYYSFDYGPIHFAILHSCVERYDGNMTEQYEWIRQDLEDNKDAIWKVVMVHRPVFASSQRDNAGDYDDLKEGLLPILEQYGVDIVLSGHDHFYERLLNNNITYIVTGGAGAPLYKLIDAYKLEQSQYAESTLHVVLLDVYENQMDLRAINTSYGIIDRFTINRINKPDLHVENLPSTREMLLSEAGTIDIIINNIGEEDILVETTSIVECSNGEDWILNVPALAKNEKAVFSLDTNYTDVGSYLWTVRLDTEEEVDEVVEENNEVSFIFNIYLVTEESPFFGENIWSIISISTTILLVATIRVKIRKKKN